MKEIITTLKSEMLNVLTTNILPYWMKWMVDYESGGFHGRITGDEQLMPDAEKGAILNARILWAFSAAYRQLGNPEYLVIAKRAKQAILDNFYDKEYGGIYWSIDNKNRMLDAKKQIYANGFAIYGLSELYRASGDFEALTYAIKLFGSIESHSYDKEKGGYFEALSREWNQIDDMRLSEKDANERKTMNTHLHILESYTNLFRVWKDEQLRQKLRNLIYLFMDKILNKKTYHLQLFFDDNWNSKYDIVSYGHDIEASWLLLEASLVLGEADVLTKVLPLVRKIAEAAAEGYMPGFGMISEQNKKTGITDRERAWWVQCETVIGYINIYQYFGDEVALKRAADCWSFIKTNLIDKENGEWFWSVCADGTINKNDDKAGFWKCPYHNSRMCLEMIERNFD
ncbi:MAG: AGE family epimerase/isomerase [Bacteroidaceae bacterium]|nr:AGE family epimerase/isomerase [Bacteroidaceae bacterium]